MMPMASWQRLPVALNELCINTTLQCGQSFRWRKSIDDVWSCTLHGRVLSLRQDADAVHYRALFPPNAVPVPAADDTLALLHHYFNLAPDLQALYDQWAAADPNFKKRAPAFAGIRVLRQDAWEALIGFICSSNNNISRISSMVHNLCIHYGPLIAHIDDVPYHDFPTPHALSGPNVEVQLSKMGFGYRAKYIAKTARMVANDKGLDWLHELSNPECPQFGDEVKPAGEMHEGGRDGYRRAHEELLALHGVGPKVADCVALFGLGWSESVPVDTHVWQIAQRDYKFGKGKHSSLTPATYSAVGNHFRKLWGREAGWAHSVLFTADLKAFSGRVKAEVKETVKQEVIRQPDPSTGPSNVKREISEAIIDSIEPASVVKQEHTEHERILKQESTVERGDWNIKDDSEAVAQEDIKQESVVDENVFKQESIAELGESDVKQEEISVIIGSEEPVGEDTAVKQERVKQDSVDTQESSAVKQEALTVRREHVKEERSEHSTSQQESSSIAGPRVKTVTRKRTKTEPTDEPPSVKVEEENLVVRRSKRRRI